MNKYFFQLMAVINIIYSISGMNMLMSEQILFQLTALLTMLFCVTQNTGFVIKSDALKPFVALGMLAVINAGIHNFDLYVLNATIDCCLGIMVVWLGFMFMRSVRGVKGTIVVSTFIVITAFFVSGNFGNATEYAPIVGNLPRLGNLIGIVMPIAYQVHPVIALVLAVVSVLIKELVPCAIFLMMVFLYNKKYRGYIVAVTVLVLLALFEKIKTAFGVRIQTWVNAIASILKHPWAGVGFGQHFAGRESLLPGVDNMIFSSILKTLSGLGVWFIAWAVYAQNQLKIRFCKADAIPLSIIIMSTVEYPFEIGKLWYVIAILLSIWLIERGECNENSIS